MKREFLQSMKVGEMPLGKEVIDAIMAENGRDIQKVRSGFSDYEDMKARIAELERKNGELEQLKAQSEVWQTQLAESKAAMERLRFDQALELAVRDAGGRSSKAIAAMLDLPALRESENPGEAMKEALAALKKDSGYLFEAPQLPPAYAAGTGTHWDAANPGPATLAGALREKFERK